MSVLPLYFLAEGMRVSLVSISSSSEILSTVVRYSITLVSRSGRREISKMCSMYDRLSAWEVLLEDLITEKASSSYHYINHLFFKCFKQTRSQQSALGSNKGRNLNNHQQSPDLNVITLIYSIFSVMSYEGEIKTQC